MYRAATEQAQQADDDQVRRDHVIQKPRHDQNQNSRDEGNERTNSNVGS
jgi:hypothetical protein